MPRACRVSRCGNSRAEGDIRVNATSGMVVAKYVYDAWGKHKMLNPDGRENTNSIFFGNINLLRLAIIQILIFNIKNGRRNVRKTLYFSYGRGYNIRTRGHEILLFLIGNRICAHTALTKDASVP